MLPGRRVHHAPFRATFGVCPLLWQVVSSSSVLSMNKILHIFSFSSILAILQCCIYATIDVKLQGWRGGGEIAIEGYYLGDFDIIQYPQGGEFDTAAIFEDTENPE